MSNKLLIKHFPTQMPLEERKQLLHNFGAMVVHCFPDSLKMKCCAFATFQDETMATLAMRHLHQLLILGSRLSVEYAKDDKLSFNRKGKILQVPENGEKEFEVKMKKQLAQLQNISPALGLNYPFPPLLKYKYPPANDETVANIANALLCNPRFYTQVLHLMNKMSLPPPFVSSEDVFVNDTSNLEVCTASESESEIETENDSFGNRLPIERSCFHRKRKKLDIGFVGNKKPRKIVKSNKNTVSFGVNDVFESKTLQTKPNIAINVTDVLPTINEETSVVEGGFGTIGSVKVSSPEVSQEETVTEFVSGEELRRNRLSQSELNKYSVFKNYEPGNSSCRLYVKNVDKNVEVNDLKRIFGKFVDWESETEKNAFDICLLKQGRMKGQAFVTFHSEDLANDALRETNGFVLKGKPLVVVFARSAKSK